MFKCIHNFCLIERISNIHSTYIWLINSRYFTFFLFIYSMNVFAVFMMSITVYDHDNLCRNHKCLNICAYCQKKTKPVGLLKLISCSILVQSENCWERSLNFAQHIFLFWVLHKYLNIQDRGDRQSISNNSNWQNRVKC